MSKLTFQIFCCCPLSLSRKEGTGREWKNKTMDTGQEQGRVGATPTREQVNFATTTKDSVRRVDMNVQPRSADMPPTMQYCAFRYIRVLLDAYLKKKSNPTHFAMRLKKECPSVYKSWFSYLFIYFPRRE